jgi:hypothetical protein
MSDDRNFVARWSRLKREAENDKDAPGGSVVSPKKPDESEAARSTPATEPGQPATPETAFDVSSLPPIDSITASTDIRDFLRAGVPADLTKAALRRAWSEDTAIRDFIGIAENQWDFTDPTSIPGFGPLQATDNIHDLVAQAMGKLEDRLAQPAEASPLAVAGGPEPSSAASGPNNATAALSHGDVEQGAAHEDADAASCEQQVSERNAVAPQHEPPVVELKRRKHGRALPS